MTAALLLAPPRPAAPPPAPSAVTAKIMIAGGRAADRAALVRALADPPPARRAPRNAPAARGRTQPAWSYGRATVGPALVLHLFGMPDPAPGEAVPRVAGALGALVLLDRDRPADARPVLDFFEDEGIAVAALTAGPAARGRRTELDLHDAVPLVACDVRDRASARAALLALLGGAVVASV